MQILLTHPGTQYSYALAAQLQRLGLLYFFVTGLAVGETVNGKPLSGWRRWLARRKVAGVPDEKIRRIALPEFIALFWLRWMGHQREAILFRRNRNFQQAIPQHLIDNADVIIGFDTSSWILAERCRKAGKPFILDASIAHPLGKQTIYTSLQKRFPAWTAELQTKDPGHVATEQREMEIATHIVCASSFTRGTLTANGIPAANISVNSYGTDLTYFRSRWAESGQAAAHGQTAPPQGPANTRQAPTFLFFGTKTARKGLPWLMEIWPRFANDFPAARLIVAGYYEPPAGFQYPAGVVVKGGIPPAERDALFAEADVLVFPSFFEGFAQVIIEAMATGMPVITTTATIGPELIVPGHTGFVMEPGHDAALLHALQYFATHPHLIEPMGRAARTAVEGYTWDAYGERWKGIVENLKG